MNTSIFENSQRQEKKLTRLFFGLYITILITSIISANRVIPLEFFNHQIYITGATLIIPFALLIQDIITEVYGYTMAKRMVQIGILCLSICILYELFLTRLPFVPQPSNEGTAYNEVFLATFKHYLAFIISIFLSNLANDYVISSLKVKFGGKHLPFRFILGALIGEIGSLTLGFIIWFHQVNIVSALIGFLLLSSGIRMAFEVITIPISWSLCSIIKKFENTDVYDKKIDYNPFT